MINEPISRRGLFATVTGALATLCGLAFRQNSSASSNVAAAPRKIAEPRSGLWSGTTTYSYDSFGRLESIRHDGNRTTFVYDSTKVWSLMDG